MTRINHFVRLSLLLKVFKEDKNQILLFKTEKEIITLFWLKSKVVSFQGYYIRGLGLKNPLRQNGFY